MREVAIYLLVLCICSCTAVSTWDVEESVALYRRTDDYIKENFDDYGHVYDQLKDSLKWREQNNIYPYHHFILHD